MPTPGAKHLTPTEIKWLEDTYDTMRRRLLVPTVGEMISHYYCAYPSRKMAHQEAETAKDVEKEIGDIVLDIQAKEQ
ncbi:hypothetical protein EG328_004498, partial [Venturia inaequalis]